MVGKIITAIASGASIVSLAFIPNLPSLGKWLLVIVGITCILYLIYQAIVAGRINETVCHSANDIQDKMKSIIKMQGKVCILSRDLSWLNGEIESALKDKASSVLIFAEAATPATRRLAQSGVKVKYYGNLGFSPNSRFTVIRYNRDDPQVAIANTRNTIRKSAGMQHTIYMTDGSNPDKRDAWLNTMALDMITLFDKIATEAPDSATN